MTTKDPKSVYDFVVKDAKGDDVDLSFYKGKVLLIVNVASQCGLTNSNYTELNQLYDQYIDQGLEILAFPCNQFGKPEPESNDKIVDFICTRFKSEFPIFHKIEVNGEFLVMIFSGTFPSSWLIRMDKVVGRYYPTTSLSLERDIHQLLVAMYCNMHKLRLNLTDIIYTMSHDFVHISSFTLISFLSLSRQ